MVVKIPRAKNIKLKLKVGMARGPVLHGQKQSSRVLRLTMKRCIMTESLWSKYDLSRKSSAVPVKRSPKVARKERTLALNAPWDSIANGWWGSYISPLYDCQRGLLRRRQTEQKTTKWSYQCAHYGDVPSQKFASLPGYQCYLLLLLNHIIFYKLFITRLTKLQI